MEHEDQQHDERRIYEWYGWGSPVGMGILALCIALSLAAVLAAVSLFF
jgi:hypothetical protein